MVLELIVITLPIMLYWQGFIRLYTLLYLLITTYWLPKWLFLELFIERFYPSIITRNQYLPENEKYIALTFDDAPYDSYEEIIKILDMYNMKATFFIISDYVTESNKQILINAVKNGHQIANHGKTNSIHAIKSFESLINEVDTCDQLIRSIYHEAGVDLPKMFYRPGCGAFTKKMLRYIETLNYKLALGSIYPYDPIIRSSLHNYYYITNHLENGDVVILHDKKWTVPLLQKLLPYFNEYGYRAITLHELFI